jgi:hypothetical protein
MRRILLLVPCLAVAVVPAPRQARGCGAAPPPGESVGVNAEEAVILYDAASRTEHFIRRADFRTEAKDFGFLVPTPSKPELGETRAEIFQALHAATQPRYVPSGNVRRIVQKRGRHEGAAAAAAPGAPEVLDEKTNLAGYDLVVLRAEDTEGLRRWLEDHGYDARPALMAWLGWYVENRWVITAFKVAKGPDAHRDRWAKAVRLSFPTESPFYPYREPEDMRTSPPAGPRTLRVFFLGDARHDGSLGRGGRWAGRTVWANACPESTMRSVASGLGLGAAEAEAIGSRAWFLTEFEDESSPRPGTSEVFFSRAGDQSTVERPVVYYDQYEYVFEDEPVGGDLERPAHWAVLGVAGVAGFGLAGGLIALWVWQRRRWGGVRSRRP